MCLWINNNIIMLFSVATCYLRKSEAFGNISEKIKYIYIY